MKGKHSQLQLRNSTWWPIHIINSLSVDKTKLSLSCNNIYEKITHVWLAENKCIFHVTKVQLQMACVLPKFCHSWLSAMHFSCKLLTIINITYPLQHRTTISSENFCFSENSFHYAFITSSFLSLIISHIFFTTSLLVI